MLRIAIAVLMLAAFSVSTTGAALAQWGWFWDDNPYHFKKRPYKQGPGDGFWGDGPRPPRAVAPRPSRSKWWGGPRPAVAPITPDRIAFPSAYPAGSIVIDHRGRQLFLIETSRSALRYPISVGREGYGWSGTERISKIVDWPDWYPPADMRARDPRLPVHMSGGLKNPLGAKALYLGESLYRIHGTNDPRSIGRASSSGCFRMLNGHVVDLASRVGVGSTVTVVARLPGGLARTVAEQVGGDLPPKLEARRPRARPPAALDDLFEEGFFDDEPMAGEGAGASVWVRPF